ncbi:hypothetical protein EIP91_002954 [Steccherinum ochraceum]|uniref:Uncharacterized protein n=1 Tax=Steccherinum ochraceum TaxID=92696 RepID=A0A4R0RDT4_9APHY|nr:hypothetical protein EIP91_002954 [Steccherinum ochraceum]
MLSLNSLLRKLLNPFATSPKAIVTSASDPILPAISFKASGRPRYGRTCCFGRRRSSPKEMKMEAHRVELFLFDQTMSTLSADESLMDGGGNSTLVDFKPISEKGFSKVSGTKLTWHGEAARSLDEWNHLNSVSQYVPLSPISMWEDTDLDLEDEESYDWFGERPPVVLTTGINSIFLRHVLPGLKAIHSARKTSTPSPPPTPRLVERIYAWFGR